MAIDDRAVRDADHREQLGIADEEERRLPVRELVDREGLAPDDPVANVGADQQQDDDRPAEDPEELLHGNHRCRLKARRLRARPTLRQAGFDWRCDESWQHAQGCLRP
jgi:hypothetical protein